MYDATHVYWADHLCGGKHCSDGNLWRVAKEGGAATHLFGTNHNGTVHLGAVEGDAAYVAYSDRMVRIPVEGACASSLATVAGSPGLFARDDQHLFYTLDHIGGSITMIPLDGGITIHLGGSPPSNARWHGLQIDGPYLYALSGNLIARFWR